MLTLVSEQKVDIGAVSVSEVADQYLAYLDSIRELDMEVASEFIEVASTLLAIKAASLLPSDVEEDYDEEYEDLSPSEARNILIARLIAYKQFKNVAAALSSRLESEGRMHTRQAGLEPVFMGLLPDYLEGVTLHSLAVICADLTSRRQTFLLEAEHITAKPIPVEERIDAIYRDLRDVRSISFTRLLDGATDAMTVVVSFLAVLELYHRGMIDIEQPEEFGNITIICRDPDEWAPAAADEPEPDIVVEYLDSKEQ
ncbi:MAG: segregation/condensation protein A [Coriobacteriales bacterium]|nr:segregation/condensation protein A [Coriobacteriales bacterium]